MILERNDNSWQPRPAIARIRFAVVPDAITRALELEKGSADVCINCLTADMVYALAKRPNLQVESGPGHESELHLVQHPGQCAARRSRAPGHCLRDESAADYSAPCGGTAPSWRRACCRRSTGRGLETCSNILMIRRRRTPCWTPAGWKRGNDGVRFRLAMKTSTDETSRLLAMILQQQLRDIGIALEVRSFEFATFYSDISKGAFQMYTLRWLGGNEDPDIFRYAYDSHMFPPHGANRGRYVNAGLRRIDQRGGHVERPGPAPHRLCEGAANSRCRVALDQLVVFGCSAGAHQAATERPHFQLRQLRFPADRYGDRCTLVTRATWHPQIG